MQICFSRTKVASNSSISVTQNSQRKIIIWFSLTLAKLDCKVWSFCVTKFSKTFRKRFSLIQRNIVEFWYFETIFCAESHNSLNFVNPNPLLHIYRRIVTSTWCSPLFQSRIRSKTKFRAKIQIQRIYAHLNATPLGCCKLKNFRSINAIAQIGSFWRNLSKDSEILELKQLKMKLYHKNL